ncbi:MAG: nucleotidyltransferase domain-containing protein [Syntrophales bacterium]
MALANSLALLAETFHLADIYVFGSRAKEIAARMKEESTPARVTASDVDIGIRTLRGVTLSPKELASLTVHLEDLFEVNRVDVVLLPSSDPFLALDIIRGELLYTRDPLDQARYELLVLRRAGDLAPFKRARMEMIMQGHGR